MKASSCPQFTFIWAAGNGLPIKIFKKTNFFWPPKVGHLYGMKLKNMCVSAELL